MRKRERERQVKKMGNRDGREGQLESHTERDKKIEFKRVFQLF